VKTTIDTVLLEVKVSAREIATAYRETQAKYEAVRAFTEDLEISRHAAASGSARRTAGRRYLDTMLDAQDRRANAEEEFIRAAALQIAVVNLERAGTC
jgi:outer membrane protein TolC